ncbi:hypothetical protein [Paractinoplanes maris]|uniref:hypothetical protein n=1 Tax=Paractinoplanes maris TaxID=1734446 RepID=UPI0020216E29|nr:hypothetical protein [Actinoplanes maris]
MTDFAEIRRLLEAGRSLEEIARLRLPEPWRRAMRVCAAAGVFGPELYEQVLSRHSGPGAPALGDLIARGLVQSAGAGPEQWRVPGAEATEWMLDWQEGWQEPGAPPALVTLERDLVTWHSEAGDPYEHLRHLLVADSGAALALFEELFRAADRVRDFAGGQDLLNVLDDPHRVTYAGPAVSARRLDAAGYLRARLFWAVSYSRSAQFLVPDGLRERADRLLSAEGPRVWQVFAPTGTGKTVQLQWLVARRCVPAEFDVPCARVDFDLIDAGTAARHPWLLLLEIADQLERRWARRVFERLDRFSSYRNLLQQPTSELARTAAESVESQGVDRLERAVTEVFVRRFNAAAGDGPVLLVVDTLEEVLLGHGADALLRKLAELVTACRGLRLVLAGRYDLRERAGPALATFESVESVELGDFTAEQTLRYLREIRRVPDPERYAGPVQRRTGGHPFMVAMFADILEEEPRTEPDELLRFHDPALRLLIDRVIRRIRDGDVRWLVRYGVVPRRLHYNDVIEVMWPYLVSGREGPSDQDDPRTDEHHRIGEDDIFPFGTPRDKERLNEAWDHLLTYAAHRSWVSEPARDGRTVVFHQKVRVPMRELIAPRKVARQLHLAFRDRFDELAAAHPEAPAPYLRESFYHRVQLGDPNATEFWRRHLLRLRENGDLDSLADLAGEVLGDDYRDEDGVPRKPGNGPQPVRWVTVLQALVWLAYVAVERARAGGQRTSDPHWSEAEALLARARAVRDAGQVPGPRGGLEVAMVAAVQCAYGDPAGAAELVRRALPTASADSHIDLLRVYGDVLANHRPGDDWVRAVRAYQDALDLVVPSHRPDQAEPLALSLSRLAETTGDLTTALRWARHTRSETAKLREAELLITMFRPSAALDVLAGLRSSDAAGTVRRALVEARACSLLGRSRRALSVLDTAAEVAAGLETSVGLGHLAQLHQARGVILGELLELDEAEKHLLRAASLWSEVGFTEGHPECAYIYFRFLVRDVGDLQAAARLRRPPMAAGDRVAALWDDLTVELDLAETPPAVSLDGPPHQVAASIAARLAWSWHDARHLVPALAGALERIEPPRARLGVLSELARARHVWPPDQDVTRLDPLLSGIDERLQPDDDALADQLRAEWQRLSGRLGPARRLGVPAWRRLTRVDDPLAHWRGLQAMDRLGTIGQVPVPLPGGDQVLLRAASLMLLATERDPAERPSLLEEAHRLCGGITRPSRWVAEVNRSAGQLTGNPSLVAVADDLSLRLGLTRAPGSYAEISLAEGSPALGLHRPGGVPENLIDLQYQLVQDWAGLARALGRVIADGWAGPGPVRLESDDPGLHALPWELALLPPDQHHDRQPHWRADAFRGMPGPEHRLDLKWLQRGLVAHGADIEIDGVMGPHTAAALAAIGAGARVDDQHLHLLSAALDRRTAPRPKPVVVILRPDGASRHEISSHDDFGYDVMDHYARCGLRCRVVQDLRQLTPGSELTLLHVSARLDYRDIRPFFDFSATADNERRWAAKERGSDLDPHDLVRWLRDFRPGTEPVVVLDPPYPGSPYDVPWQLTLRNLFAATVFAEGVAPVVIATGAMRAGGEYVQAIARGLAEGQPLSEVARSLRRPPEEWGPETASPDWGRDADSLAGRATAIFAAPSAVRNTWFPVP